jgi:hypothetical protein
MDTLVYWKRKTSKYRDEADEDSLGPREPKLIDAMQTPEFIMRDETNAEAMKNLKIKWKWR